MEESRVTVDVSPAALEVAKSFKPASTKSRIDLDGISKVMQIALLVATPLASLWLFAKYDTKSRDLQFTKQTYDNELAAKDVVAKQARHVDYQATLCLSSLAAALPKSGGKAHAPRSASAPSATLSLSLALEVSNSMPLPLEIRRAEVSFYQGSSLVDLGGTVTPMELNHPPSRSPAIDWGEKASTRIVRDTKDDSGSSRGGGNTGLLTTGARLVRSYDFIATVSLWDWVGVVADLTVGAPDEPASPEVHQFITLFCRMEDGDSSFWSCETQAHECTKPIQQTQESRPSKRVFD